MKWKVNRIESNRMSKSTSARGESKRSTNFMFSFLFNFFSISFEKKSQKSVRRHFGCVDSCGFYVLCRRECSTTFNLFERSLLAAISNCLFCWCGSDDDDDDSNRHPHHGWADANKTKIDSKPNSEVRMHENDNRFNGIFVKLIKKIKLVAMHHVGMILIVMSIRRHWHWRERQSCCVLTQMAII